MVTTANSSGYTTSLDESIFVGGFGSGFDKSLFPPRWSALLITLTDRCPKGIMSATIYPAETNRNKVTSYIPLTSPWPSSSGCASLFRQNGPSLMAWAPGYGLDIDTKVSCNPPAVTTWWDQERLGGGGRYETRVSIGPLTCPSYFHTVVTSIKDGYSTLAMCCPS